MIALESAITSYRFGPFLAEAQSSQAALDLYVWNEAVAASLLPPLRAIEVAVRNAFNDCLKQLYSFYWYDDPAFLTMAATRPLKHLAPDIARELSRLKPPPGATKVHPDSLTAALFRFLDNAVRPNFRTRVMGAVFTACVSTLPATDEQDYHSSTCSAEISRYSQVTQPGISQ